MKKYALFVVAAVIMGISRAERMSDACADPLNIMDEMDLKWRPEGPECMQKIRSDYVSEGYKDLQKLATGTMKWFNETSKEDRKACRKEMRAKLQEMDKEKKKEMIEDLMVMAPKLAESMKQPCADKAGQIFGMLMQELQELSEACKATFKILDEMDNEWREQGPTCSKDAKSKYFPEGWKDLQKSMMGVMQWMEETPEDKIQECMGNWKTKFNEMEPEEKIKMMDKVEEMGPKMEESMTEQCMAVFAKIGDNIYEEL